MKSYCITSKPQCEHILKKYTPDFIVYRDKANENYAEYAKQFVKCCRNTSESVQVFLHQDFILAHKLGADGVHLISMQFDAIHHAKSLGLKVIVSTHSLDDIVYTMKEGADYVTYSPIFITPDKGEPKGIAMLRDVVQKTGARVFALGGIVTQEHLKAVERTGAYGFASIRYFER